MDDIDEKDAAKLNAKINAVLNFGRDLGYWTHGYDFPHLCRQIFQGIELHGKNMLEIGCGKGLFCIWASLYGSNRVVGLEPLEEGSFDSLKIYSDFKKMVNHLEIANINLLPIRIQDYNDNNGHFDIVLSVASINHLDEKSCISLRESNIARQKYIEIFRKIAKQMKKGSKLIILDCSNKNFFSNIGLSNPMEKSIEWFKHQSPEFWAQQLSECGFTNPKITWPSGRFLRYMRIYNRNKLLSYFIDSAFRLEMTLMECPD